MNRFTGFLKKEFYHIARDKRTLLILFGMPVAQVMLFGFAITNEIKNAPISILDHSRDHVTTAITNQLLSSGYFVLYDNLFSERDILTSFQKGRVKEVIVFGENFAQQLGREGTANIQILADATDPNTANTLVNYTKAIIHSYQLTLNRSKTMPIQIIPEVKMLYNPEIKGVFMFVPGVIVVILMLVSALMTSISITREKELGTMEVLMVSPLSPIQVIIGKVSPYLLLAFINTIVVLALGKFVFGVPIRGSMALLLAEGLLFIITALSLGILISTIASSQQTAMMMSLMGLMLPTILLSGFIFPVSSMPWPLQWLSNIVPAKWFLRIIKNIMLKGATFHSIWLETTILAGMAALFLTVSAKRFKLKME
ncbi:MAG: transport permease protein [Chitinophagales bacterium]|nr:MAG: transport permease protein [Chitinophagales bacterium]